MKMIRKLQIAFIFLVFITTLSACNFPPSSNTEVQEQVAQTLSAIGTQTALAASVPPVQATDATLLSPATPPLNTPMPIVHSIMPGEMQAIESTIDDIQYNADVFSRNLYERPFVPNDMQPRFDLDLQKINMSTDNTFFYFSLDLKDVNMNSKILEGNYGIEIDLDKDGRGDYLLWSYQPPASTTWDYLGIALFTDQNNDVGSVRPLVSDAIAQTDGYETEVWPGKPLTDPDGAWLRISPTSPTTVQLAVKRSLLGNPTQFLWGAWADDQIKAPYRFDYNDQFTEAEAGSPYPANPNYPVKEISRIDNTCREAWGFKPTGDEPGICKKAVATPQPTSKPKTTAKPTLTQAVNTPTTGKTPIPNTDTPTPASCSDVQVGAQVTPWDVAYTSGVTLCIDSSCQNPDAGGYAIWILPAGAYTITASAPAYGITPPSATVKLGCGEKSLSQFVIGPP